MFRNAAGLELRAEFQETDCSRPVLSVKARCEKKVQLTLFSHGCSSIIKDPGAIRKIQDIVASTLGFEIVEERGAFVLAGDLDENMNEQEPESGPAMP